MAGHNLFGVAEAGFQKMEKCSPSRRAGLLHFRETKLARRIRLLTVHCLQTAFTCSAVALEKRPQTAL